MALDRALRVSGYAELRAAQSQARVEGRLVGIGLAAYVEVCGPGPWESATVRVEPGATVTVHTGLSPHGQDTETSLAQIVGDALGVPLDQIVVLHGDTARTPTGVGTFGSRGMAVGGGAMAQTAEQVRQKIVRIAAHLLEVAPDDVSLEYDPNAGPLDGGRGVVAGTLGDYALPTAQGLPPFELDRTVTPTRSCRSGSRRSTCRRPRTGSGRRSRPPRPKHMSISSTRF